MARRRQTGMRRKSLGRVAVAVSSAEPSLYVGLSFFRQENKEDGSSETTTHHHQLHKMT